MSTQHPAVAAGGAVADDDLVKRARDGDSEAFAEIVRRHEREVWRIAASLASDRLTIENLVQECLLTAYRHLDQYKPGPDSHFGAWIRSIARNLVKNELRRASRETRRLSDYRQYVLSLWETDGAEEQEQSLSQAVAACRERLAPAVAHALRLRYEEALSIEEIAAALGRTVAGTRQLLFRARIALRLCVQKKGAFA